jgi:hypothetical protein
VPTDYAVLNRIRRTDMPNGALASREVLGYLLKPTTNMDEFITYCKFGLKDAAGNYVLDPITQLPMTGILNWLRGNEVYEGNFYIERSANPSMIVLTPQTGLPWLSIVGFSNRYLILGATIIAGLDGALYGNGVPILPEPRPDIDDLLSGSRAAFEAVAVDRQEDLKHALRGDRGTDLNAILMELGLFNVVNPV